MTLKALRTQAALYLAPWLKPKGREWKISGLPRIERLARDAYARQKLSGRGVEARSSA